MEKTVVKKSEKFIKLCEEYGVNPDNVPELISVEECYKARGLDYEKCLLNVSAYPARHQKAIQATADMFIVHEAFNQDPESGQLYEPNWQDDDEQKWNNWWDMEKDERNPSGFRFVVSRYDNVGTLSAGGSRLCSRNEDIQVFIAKHFTPKFREMMVFEK